MLSPKDSGGEPRLESWKEIAAYLNRDVRTVQRWEKTEGLPVRRHVHEAQASIYAYTAELDEWRANRASPAPAEAPPREDGSAAIPAALEHRAGARLGAGHFRKS